MKPVLVSDGCVTPSESVQGEASGGGFHPIPPQYATRVVVKPTCDAQTSISTFDGPIYLLLLRRKVQLSSIFTPGQLFEAQTAKTPHLFPAFAFEAAAHARYDR